MSVKNIQRLSKLGYSFSRLLLSCKTNKQTKKPELINFSFISCLNGMQKRIAVFGFLHAPLSTKVHFHAFISIKSTHLHILQSVPQVDHPHVITNNRLLDAVRVRGQQLRPAEPFPPHPGRASLQAQDLTRQAAPTVCAETILALSAGPRLLLVRRRRLVYGVKVERVAEVGVVVAGLLVGDGLVGRREVRGLEVRTGRV